MVCHMHPGENMEASYLGLTWWDNESDGDKMYPAKQVTPSPVDEQEKLNRNPEAASLRGLWSDPAFLAKTGTPEFNGQLKRTQFADFHGHGWLFRQVFKRNRKGDLLDANDQVVSPDDADRFAALIKALRHSDYYMVTADFDAYFATQRSVERLWLSTFDWTRASMLNIARMAWFSSDRTIGEYAQDVWQVPFDLPGNLLGRERE